MDRWSDFRAAVLRLPTDTDVKLWRIAVHEAAHAVVLRLLRVRHGHLSLRPNREVKGYVRVLRPKGHSHFLVEGARRKTVENIAALMAPLVVDVMFDGRDRVPDTTFALEHGHLGDLRDVDAIAAPLFTADQRHAVYGVAAEVAYRVLMLAWPAVVAVATAAAASPSQRLSAREIALVIDRAGILWFGSSRARLRRWARRPMQQLDFSGPLP